ncbi:MAG: hypothetical protein A3F84_08385 [Candidatus Handelsmanbacteria bacterium RIFCSPLOWO2_12_FULL_64_10]|uniref:Uncharacterized protein n=1 Tax=Handelsmanbacteria sp. (strain RIFCSPLOWO2_12_FULL_64_10) TaxID=1817868 RepID=A0A1F6D5M7_HANXR|nr:MAG: hypothetical protein A3F84_08385 [Candidatus Handelsmanbacteria bacterium RIFCSPLOWO2_12_FULL_64_10]
MNGITKRLERLEGAAKGICISCLWNDLACDHPHWEGSRRCGRDRQDLPSVLFANEEDAAYQSWVRDLTDDELEREIARLKEEDEPGGDIPPDPR